MLFFLDIDLNVIEDFSVGTLLAAVDVGELFWDGDIDTRGTSCEGFFDIAGRRDWNTIEGPGLAAGCSDAKDVVTKFPGVEETRGGILGVATCRAFGGEIGHGAICWPRRWVLTTSSRFWDC
jgi:hypothetical protein